MNKLEKIMAVMNRIYWSRRFSSPHKEGYVYPPGLWNQENFTSYDYDDGDAKNAIDEIAKILRPLEEGE